MKINQKENYKQIKNIYKNILFRCYNKKCPSFHRYGGRKISMCTQWRNNFEIFYNWCIESGYAKGLSIDRIDNDLGYNPNNCRWTNKTIQARNTCKIQKNNTSGYRGVYLYKRTGKYVVQIRVNYTRINLGAFTTAIDAAKAYDNYIISNNLEHTKNFNINDI